MRPLIVGNWKMNSSLKMIDTFCQEVLAKPLPDVDLAICPPFVYLTYFISKLGNNSPIKVGAQDVGQAQQGAFTGQVSARMLGELGCEYAIMGHSERRQFCYEKEQDIADKFFAAKEGGVVPILCVGESLQERESGLTDKIVTNQLKTILSKDNRAFMGAILAYEPVWAIGTGLSATPEQAQAVHHLLRDTIGGYDDTSAELLPILYGGSVKPENAEALFAMPDINGALVGGASLKAADFLGIACAVHTLQV